MEAPSVKAPRFCGWNYDAMTSLSRFAFNFNLLPYIKDDIATQKWLVQLLMQLGYNG